MKLRCVLLGELPDHGAFFGRELGDEVSRFFPDIKKPMAL
jgi:hypothetical protein